MSENKIAPASPKALALAASGFGNLLINMYIYHVGHFGDKREEAFRRISKMAHDTLNVSGVMNGTPEEVAEARRLIEDILFQVDAHTRKHLGIKDDRPSEKLN